MGSEEDELALQLIAAGNKLAEFPTQVNQLLPLLDKVENLLSKVEQSPSKRIQEAYSQSMEALLAEPLLRHSDDDVRVAIASCISEITRITAPEAPYNDDQMKEIFQLIVSSFEKLSDKSCRSYDKRRSILETVAKVRSCVVMLDLECEALISEMFQHFFNSIRDYHPENVFTSMETIMTLVLEESEDITIELLTPILASVKIDNEDNPTIARKLGENVIKKSAIKLKPCLKHAVNFLGVSIDSYSKIVASICEGTNGEVDQNGDNAAGEQLADESKLTTASSDGIAHDEKEHVIEDACRGEVPSEVLKSGEALLSNGVTDIGGEEMSDVTHASKKPDESNLSSKSLDVNLNKVDANDSDAGQVAKAESDEVKTAKRRGKKHYPVLNLTEPSDSSRVDSDKEAEITYQKTSEKEDEKSLDFKGDNNDNHSLVGEDQEVDTGVSSEKEKKLTSQNSSPKLLDSEDVNVSPLSPSKILPDESIPKKDGVSKNKEDVAQEDASSVDTVPGEVAVGSSDVGIKPELSLEKKKESLAQEDALSVDFVAAKTADVNSDSDVNPPNRYRQKKENVTQDQEPSMVRPCPATVAEDGTSDSEIKPQSHSKKNENLAQEDAPSVESVSTEVADGTSDSEVKAHSQPGQDTESLVPEETISDDPVLSKVDDKLSDSEDKPLRPSGKKTAARSTRKKTSYATKGEKILAGGVKSKDDGEASIDSEAKQLTESAKKEDARDLEEKPLPQSGRKITSRPKQSGKKRDASSSEKKPLGKKGDTTNLGTKGSVKNEDARSSGTKSLTKKGDASNSGTKPLGNKGDAGNSRTKSSGRKQGKTNGDKDLSMKDDGKRRGRGMDIKGKDLLKTHAKDDDQDMSTPPKSVKDGDHLEDAKVNSKRKRTPGKDKGSGDIEYGANLVGAKIKVWWPEDREYYEGCIKKFDRSKKKYKVLYNDGDEEILNLQNEKWKFVDDGSMQEEADEDSCPDSSAESHKRKKAKTSSELLTKQKQVVASSKRGGGASSSKSKGQAAKYGPKEKMTSGRSEDNLRSDSKSVDDDGESSKIIVKSKQETPKTDIKSKGRSFPSGKKSNDRGKAKLTSSNVKDNEDAMGDSSDSGEAQDRVKEKPASLLKAGNSVGKSRKKAKISSSKAKDTRDATGESTDSGEAPDSVKKKSADLPKAGKSVGKSRKQAKVTSSKVKDTGDATGELSDSGEALDVVKEKSADLPKAGKSVGKSRKKRKRASR